MNAAHAFALRCLRYPPPIEAPGGTPGSARVFRPSPRYLRYRLARRLPAVLGAFLIEEFIRHRMLLALDRKAGAAPLEWRTLVLLELLLFLVVFAVPCAIQALHAFLDYSVKTYVLTDRALRVRSGLLFVRETTMTFSRVQDILVTRGPLQGLLGISDILVRSAGGMGGGHAVRLEAMPEAEAVEALLHELTKRATVSPSSPVEACVQALTAEARALRETAERSLS
jgi:membrane protein YdbS with pleckstrin-like domain